MAARVGVDRPSRLLPAALGIADRAPLRRGLPGAVDHQRRRLRDLRGLHHQHTRSAAADVDGSETDAGGAAMIYFLVEADQVKIGYALDIETRRKTLQTGVAKTLFIVGAYEGDVKDEKELHRRFKDYKLRGEWFSVTQKVQEYITSKCVLGYGKVRIRVQKEEVIKYTPPTYIIKYTYEPVSIGDLYVTLLFCCYALGNLPTLYNPVMNTLCAVIFPIVLFYAYMIHKVVARLAKSKEPSPLPALS